MEDESEHEYEQDVINAGSKEVSQHEYEQDESEHVEDDFEMENRDTTIEIPSEFSEEKIREDSNTDV